MSLLYELSLYLISILLLPIALWQGKGDSVRQRFFPYYPEVKTEERPIVWIHAVSYGEVRALAPLIPKILERYKEPPYLIISTVTKTGQDEAKRLIPEANQHLYLPFDFKWNIRRCLRGVKPELVVLVEGDLWPNFLADCKAKGSKVVVINAKVSEKTARRLGRLRFFGSKLYGLVDGYCAQTEKYRKRLLDLGVSPDRVVVTGNIKYDATFPKMSEDKEKEFRASLGIKPEDHVLTIGSTHEPEEKEIIKALKGLLERRGDLKVLLVPRHPERFDGVAKLFNEMGIKYSRYSKSEKGEQVILIDAMGVLCSCYQISSVAVVAGSFTDKIGGHNLLEPCAYGVPVLFGPHTFTQEEMRNLVLEAKAGKEVKVEELSKAVELQLESKKMGDSGRVLLKSLQGSSDITIEQLLLGQFRNFRI